MTEVRVDVRLAAYCVVTDADGRVLLTRWNEVEPPMWSLPGGGVELTESFEEAAVREVREESGYQVEILRILGVHAPLFLAHERLGPVRDRHHKLGRVIYEAQVVGGELTDEVDGSSDQARWFPLEEVAALHRVELVDRGLTLAGRSLGAAGTA